MAALSAALLAALLQTLSDVSTASSLSFHQQLRHGGAPELRGRWSPCCPRLCLRGGCRSANETYEQPSESEPNMVDEAFEREAEQLVDAMEEHMLSPPDFLPIVEKLYNASEISKSHRIEIMRYGASRKLLSMLSLLADRQCLKFACMLLENLCLDDESQILFHQLSGMDTMLKLMRKHEDDVDLLAPMLSVLTNALLMERNRRQFAESDGLDFVLQTMERFSTTAIMQEKCCAVMSNSAREKDMQKKLADDKIIRMVHDAMKAFPDDRGVLMHTCLMFTNIAFEDDSNRDKIRAQEGHKTVKNITKRFKHDREILSCAQWALGHLIRH
uniref:Protein HGH1 homolog n=1 Tax=Guillardia theta TaxID=55529 RepID=A0A6U5ZGQ5_GUITH